MVANVDPELLEHLTTLEIALIVRMFKPFYNNKTISHDSPLWHPEFAEYEPVTPGVLICYLRNETICNEWPNSLINHCRFFLEEQPEETQALARRCYYFWEGSRRDKVNWLINGF
jgi:hypothetical protein